MVAAGDRQIACSTLVTVRRLIKAWYPPAVDHDPADLARSRSGRGLWLVLAVLLLVAAAVFTGLNLMRYFTVDEVRLPDLVGLPQEQAALLVRREGLEPVSFVEYVADASPGAVTSQAPVAGAIVKQGRTVHLGVNTASAEARVPDMLGMREEDARSRAQELNLPLGTVVYRSGEQAVGTVVEQTPAGGSRLAAGETVELVVSRGRERAVVTLPELVGVDVDEAMTRLADLGFTRVESIAAAVSFSAPRTVVAMSPAQGASVVQSTPVLLHYALSSSNVVTVPEIIGYPQWRAQLSLRAAQLEIGVITHIQDPAQPAAGGGGIDVTQTPANEGSRSVPFTFDPTYMGVRRLLEEPYNLRLVITDDLGERTALDEQLDAGEIATTTVNVYGSEAMLQTFIDGVFFQAWRP